MSISGKSAATVRTYLSGISAAHKIKNWQDPTDNFLIEKLLKGLAKESKSKDTRYPITLQRLESLVGCLHAICHSKYEESLFKAAFTMTFAGCFRMSELIGQGKRLEEVGGRSGLLMIDIKALFPTIRLKLRGSKTDQYGIGQMVEMQPMPANKSVCPVMALADYLTRRPGSTGAMVPEPGTPGSLLIHKDGSKLSRYQFQAVIKKAAMYLGWPPEAYSSHSFRIGAATSAAMRGDSAQEILTLGRWKSEAFKAYCRADRA